MIRIKTKTVAEMHQIAVVLAEDNITLLRVPGKDRRHAQGHLSESKVIAAAKRAGVRWPTMEKVGDENEQFADLISREQADKLRVAASLWYRHVWLVTAGEEKSDAKKTAKLDKAMLAAAREYARAYEGKED